MGYYTAYSLTTKPNNEPAIEQLRKENEFAEYAFDEFGNTSESTKWYRHDEDMVEFSKKHPETLFILDGEGEEHGDLWRTYYQNGKTYRDEAEIVFRDFNIECLRELEK